MNTRNWIMPVVLTLLVVGAGIGIGYLFENFGENENVASASSAYHLDLVITTNNYFNSSVGNQPAFFVLSHGQLLSSANITLPSKSTVVITIFCYDDGNASVDAKYLKVTGTQNNTELVMNNTMMNATQEAKGIHVAGEQTVSSLSASVVAHTFTIPALGINIPVPLSSIVQTTITTGSSGTYSWQCEAACGSGVTGWGGAMDTPGWMMGSISVA